MSYVLGKQRGSRKQGCTQLRLEFACRGIKSWPLLTQEQLGVVMHPVGPLLGREAETQDHIFVYMCFINPVVRVQLL